LSSVKLLFMHGFSLKNADSHNRLIAGSGLFWMSGSFSNNKKPDNDPLHNSSDYLVSLNHHLWWKCRCWQVWSMWLCISVEGISGNQSR
jgi:hypothetical protein